VIRQGINDRLKLYSRTAALLLMCFSLVEPVFSKDNLQNAEQVTLTPPELAVMAKFLSHADDDLKRDFAVLALIALRQAYADVLERSKDNSAEIATSNKVSRWHQATRDYIGRIGELQLLIESAADFSLSVTRENWVLIAAQDKRVLLAGPTANDAAIFSKIKREYCQFHDCDWLKQELITLEDESTAVHQGAWVFSQKQTPTFEVGSQFKFIFKKFSQKEAKQHMAYAAVNELNTFLMELKKAKYKGYLINWALLSQGVPAAGVDQTVFLNAGDLYLRLNTPLLMYLEKGDWLQMLKWLERSLNNSAVSALVIQQADSLLNADRLNQTLLKNKAR
tara:strand:- start:159543 stop:160550 length:1008 start_codon:yes stop_codon:yes gene_type:complete